MFKQHILVIIPQSMHGGKHEKKQYKIFENKWRGTART